jgi:GH15 family glucan-1,4-alpha-glucosidase
MHYEPIENHGVIGDLNTAALVSMGGSIDFMCFPRFDSPTIFAALLDSEKGGHFKIAPAADGFKSKQRYFPDTNILLTRFLGNDGVAEISDFMAMDHLGHSHDLIRRVKVIRGEVRFRLSCAPKFDYGRVQHRVEKTKRQILFIPHSQHLPALRLRTDVPLRTENGGAMAEFRLRSGQTSTFILEEAKAGEESPSQNVDYVSETFKETMNYWLAWVARSHYRGRWREMVNRSALTLKLLTCLQHGSIVAAATFGLPESMGGMRNWDYRYTWIRDASFSLSALMRLGYKDEARAFMSWMETRCRDLKPGRPLQVMYRLDGGRELPEKILKNFEGYKKSAPVRIGNAACQQLQLDIYGELLDSVCIYDNHDESISYHFWTNLATLVEWV